MFVNLNTGDRLPLSDAIESGLVTAEYENGQESSSDGSTETITYAVNSIVDQVCARPAACCFCYLGKAGGVANLCVRLYASRITQKIVDEFS